MGDKRRLLCAGCGGEFVPTLRQWYKRTKHKHYCSEACRFPRLVKTCPTCRNSFVVPTSKASKVCCSWECYKKSSQPEVSCTNCGSLFLRVGSRQKYCTAKCYRDYLKEQAKPTWLRTTCNECGVEFNVSKRQFDKLLYKPQEGRNCYCSKECLYKSRSRISRERWATGAQKWTGTPGQLRAAKHLGEYSRRNKKFGSDHPNWRGGTDSIVMKEIRLLRGAIDNLTKPGESK